MKKTVKRVLLTLLFGLVSLIISSVISFLISQTLPGDPVLAYLPAGYVHPEMYDAMYHRLRLDQPFLIRLVFYVLDMGVGEWGRSLNILHGALVLDLIVDRIPSTLILLLIPLILGFVLGFILGNFSMRFNTQTGEKVVRILSLLGFVIPIILLTLSFQFFPIKNMIFLWIMMTISHTALTITLVRIYLKKRVEVSEKRSNILFVLMLGVSYGIVYLFFIQIEIMFSFGGIGELLLQAFSSTDYWVCNAVIYVILISAPIVIIFSLFSFFLFGKIKKTVKN